MTSKQTHQIVIVGGNFGGINFAHQLLRQTLPALEKQNPAASYHVTLVSPNSHFFFKIASPRALINPTLIPEDKIFKSIAEAFKQYDASKFTFIQGKAVSLQADRGILSVKGSSGAQTQEVQYDSLVIATGTTSISPLWTLHDDHKTSQDAIKSFHDVLPKAGTILIAGGGPVGVETAGEIATNYPKAKITLIAGADRVLPRVKPEISAKAKKILQDIGVTVKEGLRIAEGGTPSNGKAVSLSDGSSQTPDVYIDATGPRKINSDWLPSQWLDASGRVVTRDSHFRVKVGGSDLKNVYAIGDIVSGTNKTAIEVDAMIPPAAASLAIDISEGWKDQKASNDEGLLSWLNPFAKASPLTPKEYKPMKDTIVIPIGPNGGVGQVFGWNMPGFMVKKGKSENFLMQLVDPLVTGTKWA